MPDFNTVGAPNYAGPLVNFGGLSGQQKKPAQQQQQGNNSNNSNPGQNLGAAVGEWLRQYRLNMQQVNPQLTPQAQQQFAPPSAGTSSGGAIY